MNKELRAGDVLYDEKGAKYIIKSTLAEGAQGRVYELENGMVAKILFRRGKTSDELLKHLRWIVRQDIPKKARLSKPLSILTEPNLGYVMLKVPAEYEPLSRYTEFNKNYSRKEWFIDLTGGIKKRLQIGLQLAESLRSLHFHGFTYCDLSPANVIVAHNQNGIALIDSDNLIATGIFETRIIGTPGYIAPELINELRQPNSFSDIYSYAVLLFELLRLCHPLVGDDILNDTPTAEQNAKEGNAAYVCHPTDNSNRRKLANDTVSFSTDELNTLFEITFAEGLQKPTRRPSLSEFIDALQQALDRLATCVNPDCHATFYFKPDENAVCPFCKLDNNKIAFLKFRRQSWTTNYRIKDFKNPDTSKNLSTKNELTGIKVLDEGANFVRKRHFDSSTISNGNEKILKVQKVGPEQYEVYLGSDELKLFIRESKNSFKRMMKNQAYPFIRDVTQIILKPTTSLFDGEDIPIDEYDIPYIVSKGENIMINDYITIDY